MPIRLLNCDDEAAHREHMARVQARYAYLATPQAAAQMQTRTAKVASQASNEHRKRLFATASKAPTAKKRIHWLRQEADLAIRAASEVSACRAGCSQCCHMSVAVSEQEARVIAQERGLTLRQPPAERVFTFDFSSLHTLDEQAKAAKAMQDDAGRFHGMACPFLDPKGASVGRACSIYASRPLSCRNLINLDSDELLCKLVEGASISVPYLDRTESQMISMIVLGASVRVADIRDWFGESPLIC